MTNLKKVCLVMLVVILLGATAVFATDGDTILITQQNTVVGGNTVENEVNNNTIITPQNTLIESSTSSSTYNNTTNLPQTGADDYAVIAVIAVLAISAVYAYKKINDYKNI